MVNITIEDLRKQREMGNLFYLFFSLVHFFFKCISVINIFVLLEQSEPSTSEIEPLPKKLKPLELEEKKAQNEQNNGMNLFFNYYWFHGIYSVKHHYFIT